MNVSAKTNAAVGGRSEPTLESNHPNHERKQIANRKIEPKKKKERPSWKHSSFPLTLIDFILEQCERGEPRMRLECRRGSRGSGRRSEEESRVLVELCVGSTAGADEDVFSFLHSGHRLGDIGIILRLPEGRLRPRTEVAEIPTRDQGHARRLGSTLLIRLRSVDGTETRDLILPSEDVPDSPFVVHKSQGWKLRGERRRGREGEGEQSQGWMTMMDDRREMREMVNMMNKMNMMEIMEMMEMMNMMEMIKMKNI